ncbi:MAG TPA: peptidoglycan DD-metalloendopeptidase family protein [Gammaproteobacteria bacterium]|nr:peptidoglycan DD-metalloendopeptidase family protein [Gammaproteobacteria bacterium]
MLTAQLPGCGGRSVAPVETYAYYQKPRGNTHRVGAGDTLYSIAWAYGVDYRDLAAHNGIDEPFTIYPGQRLHIGLDTKRRTSIRSSQGPGAPTRSLSAEPEQNTSASSPVPVKPPPPAESSATKESAATSNRGKAAATRGNKIKQWVWPAKGQIVTDFASSGRKGVDIAGKLGQPVLAAADGRVVYAGGGLRGYGELIIVKHNKRYLSAYAHNNRILVKEGDEVKIGQRIAEMGSTGTEGVRLHFEIRRDGKPVNPVRYLPR